MKQFIGEKLKTNKIFGAVLTLISVFGLCCTIFQIVSYDSAVRPFLFELPAGILDKYPNALPLYPAWTQNNVSGFNNMAYFTILSNLFTDLYILSLGLSILGVDFAKKFGFNKYYAGSATMFIAITGIIYCCIMLPFIDKESTGWVYEFPALGMLDFLGYWHHMVIPILMLIIWHIPYSNEKLDKKKFEKTATVFPIAYSVFTVFRGFCGGLYAVDSSLVCKKTWFPYPFLAPDRISPYVEKLLGYTNDAANIGFTVVCYFLLAAVLLLTPLLIVKVYNKYIDFLNNKYTFLDNKMD